MDGGGSPPVTAVGHGSMPASPRDPKPEDDGKPKRSCFRNMRTNVDPVALPADKVGEDSHVSDTCWGTV